MHDAAYVADSYGARVALVIMSPQCINDVVIPQYK